MCGAPSLSTLSIAQYKECVCLDLVRSLRSSKKKKWSDRKKKKKTQHTKTHHHRKSLKALVQPPLPTKPPHTSRQRHISIPHTIPFPPPNTLSPPHLPSESKQFQKVFFFFNTSSGNDFRLSLKSLLPSTVGGSLSLPLRCDRAVVFAALCIMLCVCVCV